MQVPTETVLWEGGKIANRKHGPKRLLDSTSLGVTHLALLRTLPRSPKSPNPPLRALAAPNLIFTSHPATESPRPFL